MKLLIFERYIMRRFIGTYLFSLAIILSIFIVFDIKDKIGSFTSNHIPLREIIWDYYAMFIPYYGVQFSPMFLYLSLVFFTSKMAQKSEFIALLSGGISYFRILRPYIVTSLGIALFILVLNHFILPGVFQRKIAFEDRYMNKNYNTNQQHIHKRISPQQNLYMERYDNITNSAYRVTLETFKNGRMTEFLYADRMQWDTLKRCWNMYFVTHSYLNASKPDSLGLVYYSRERRFVDHSTLTIPFYPADMWREESKIDAKDYFELQAYIKAEREKGSDLIEIMEVEHHKRTAFPISTVILTFIGVSLSSRKSRGGVGLQMALGLLLCFIYIGMQYVFATLAKTGFTYPWLAVWFPNLIFAIIAMFIYKRAQQ